MAEAGTTSAWKSFLKNVDENQPADTVLEAAEEWLIGKDFLSPASFEGLSEEDLSSADLPAALPVKAFLKRTLRVVEAAHASKRAKSKAVAFAPVQVAEAEGSQTFQAMVGGETSAAAVAAALSSASVEVDVHAQLVKAGCPSLPYQLQPDLPVWQAVAAESEAAKKANRVAFAYIDLTAKEVLPLWMAPDTVGGKIVLPGEADGAVRGPMNANALGQLGAALKTALGSPRFFRTYAQWLSAFVRYVPVAIAHGHMSLAAVIGHLGVMSRIVEEGRQKGNSEHLAVLYDEMLRRQVARRALKRDPDLDVEAVFMKADKQLVESARSRLDAVLQVAGIKGGATAAGLVGQPGPAGPQGAQALAADSALAKQVSAAEAVQRRAEAAAKALAGQQEELNRRQQAINAGGAGFGDAEKGKGKGGKGKGGGKQGKGDGKGRAKRTQNWWDRTNNRGWY